MSLQMLPPLIPLGTYGALVELLVFRHVLTWRRGHALEIPGDLDRGSEGKKSVYIFKPCTRSGRCGARHAWGTPLMEPERESKMRC